MKNLINIAISAAVGFAIVLAVISGQGIFTAESGIDAVKYLCDGFFVAGICLFGAGVLVFSSNGGSFDLLAYGTKKFFTAMFFSKKKFEEEQKKKTFADYREARSEKKAKCSHLIISGAFFILVAVILLIVYMNM